MSPNPKLGLELSSGPVSVAILSHDPLVHAALTRLLTVRSDLHIAADLREANVALWDPGPPGESPTNEPRDISALAIPAIALVSSAEEARVAMSAGAAGAVHRGGDGSSLVAALVAVRCGLAVLDPDFTQATPQKTREAEPAEALTTRELEVVGLLADGLSNKQIASKLDISGHTAKFHVNSILGKLSAASRTAAVVRAVRLGLVTL
jgi:DNA-binding NarL/FixJ family response regulator